MTISIHTGGTQTPVCKPETPCIYWISELPMLGYDNDDNLHLDRDPGFPFQLIIDKLVEDQLERESARTKLVATTR